MWKNEKIRANKKSKNRENERKEPIENRKSKIVFIYAFLERSLNVFWILTIDLEL